MFDISNIKEIQIFINEELRFSMATKGSEKVFTNVVYEEIAAIVMTNWSRSTVSNIRVSADNVSNETIDFTAEFWSGWNAWLIEDLKSRHQNGLSTPERGAEAAYEEALGAEDTAMANAAAAIQEPETAAAPVKKIAPSQADAWFFLRSKNANASTCSDTDPLYHLHQVALRTALAEFDVAFPRGSAPLVLYGEEGWTVCGRAGEIAAAGLFEVFNNAKWVSLRGEIGSFEIKDVLVHNVKNWISTNYPRS